MKALAWMIAAIVTAPAGAAVKSYQGTGTYKMTDGKVAAYKLQVSQEPMADRTKINTKYTFNENGQDKNVEYTMFKKMLKHGFYDLVDAQDVKVGDGYCFTQKVQNRKSRVCHSEFKVTDLNMEETAMIQGNRIERMGSTVQAEMRMAYKENLRLVEAQPQQNIGK